MKHFCTGHEQSWHNFAMLIATNFSSALFSLNFKPFCSTIGCAPWLAAAADTFHSRSPCFCARCLVSTSGSGYRRTGCLSRSAQMLHGLVSLAAKRDHGVGITLQSSALSVPPPPVVFCFINVRLPPSVQKGYVHREKNFRWSDTKCCSVCP